MGGGAVGTEEEEGGFSGGPEATPLPVPDRGPPLPVGGLLTTDGDSSVEGLGFPQAALAEGLGGGADPHPAAAAAAAADPALLPAEEEVWGGGPQPVVPLDMVSAPPRRPNPVGSPKLSPRGRQTFALIP